MLNKTILFLLFLILSFRPSAQVFSKKDSINIKSILQFELGGFYGVHHVKPITDDFQYATQNGIDKGVMANIMVNLTPRWSAGIGIRNSKQTAMIGMRNIAFYESFHLTMKSNEIWVLLKHEVQIKDKKLLDLHLNFGKRNGIYIVDNPSYEQFVGSMGTRQGESFINMQDFEFYHLGLGVSKCYYISNKLQLKLFWEGICYNQPMVKQNAVYAPNHISFLNEFNLFDNRLGVCIGLN